MFKKDGEIAGVIHKETLKREVEDSLQTGQPLGPLTFMKDTKPIMKHEGPK